MSLVSYGIGRGRPYASVDAVYPERLEFKTEPRFENFVIIYK